MSGRLSTVFNRITDSPLFWGVAFFGAIGNDVLHPRAASFVLLVSRFLVFFALFLSLAGPGVAARQLIFPDRKIIPGLDLHFSLLWGLLLLLQVNFFLHFPFSQSTAFLFFPGLALVLSFRLLRQGKFPLPEATMDGVPIAAAITLAFQLLMIAGYLPIENVGDPDRVGLQDLSSLHGSIVLFPENQTLLDGYCRGLDFLSLPFFILFGDFGGRLLAFAFLLLILDLIIRHSPLRHLPASGWFFATLFLCFPDFSRECGYPTLLLFKFYFLVFTAIIHFHPDISRNQSLEGYLLAFLHLGFIDPRLALVVPLLFVFRPNGRERPGKRVAFTLFFFWIPFAAWSFWRSGSLFMGFEPAFWWLYESFASPDQSWVEAFYHLDFFAFFPLAILLLLNSPPEKCPRGAPAFFAIILAFTLFFRDQTGYWMIFLLIPFFARWNPPRHALVYLLLLLLQWGQLHGLGRANQENRDQLAMFRKRYHAMSPPLGRVAVYGEKRALLKNHPLVNDFCLDRRPIFDKGYFDYLKARGISHILIRPTVDNLPFYSALLKWFTPEWSSRPYLFFKI